MNDSLYYLLYVVECSLRIGNFELNKIGTIFRPIEQYIFN